MSQSHTDEVEEIRNLIRFQFKPSTDMTYQPYANHFVANANDIDSYNDLFPVRIAIYVYA